MKTRVMPLFSLALIVVALVFLGAGFFGGERTCYTQVDNSKVEQIEPDKGIIKLGKRFVSMNFRLLSRKPIDARSVSRAYRCSKRDRFGMVSKCDHFSMAAGSERKGGG